MGTASDNPRVPPFSNKSVKTAKPETCAQEKKRAADTARYEALAREHGADLSEADFDTALRKVARHKPAGAAGGDAKQK